MVVMVFVGFVVEIFGRGVKGYLGGSKWFYLYDNYSGGDGFHFVVVPVFVWVIILYSSTWTYSTSQHQRHHHLGTPRETNYDTIPTTAI